jgi:hypothetical protein
MKALFASASGLVVILIACLASPAFARPDAARHPERLGFEIRVAPMEIPPGGHPQTRRQYMITSVVRQLETGEALFSPRVAALSGILATVDSGSDSPVRYRATFLVDDTTAKYTVEASQDGEPLFSNTGSIQLSAGAASSESR